VNFFLLILEVTYPHVLRAVGLAFTFFSSFLYSLWLSAISYSLLTRRPAVLTNWISYSLNFSGTVSFVSYNRRRHFIIIIIAFVICSPSGATWTYVIHIFSLTNVGTTVLFLKTEKFAEICHVASIGAL
jgi:hypothetical protein